MDDETTGGNPKVFKKGVVAVVTVFMDCGFLVGGIFGAAHGTIEKGLGHHVDIIMCWFVEEKKSLVKGSLKVRAPPMGDYP